MTYHAAQEMSTKPKVLKQSLADLTSNAGDLGEHLEAVPDHGQVVLLNADVGHQLFQLPDNIKVGDTVHVDEEGRVQIIPDYGVTQQQLDYLNGTWTINDLL